MRKQKSRSEAIAVTAQLIGVFVFAFYTSSVTVQVGLCQTWSEILKTGFLASWLIFECTIFFRSVCPALPSATKSEPDGL